MKNELNTTDHASFEVNYKERKISVSGPVEFVKEQIEKIRDDFNISKTLLEYRDQDMSEMIGTNINPFTNFPTRFPNAIQLDPESKRVDILMDLSGKPKSYATVEVALMFMWGKKQLGIEEVPFQEIRNICQNHGVLDAPNFSSHINKEKQFFIINKESGNYSARLTVPGIKKAEELLSNYDKTSNQ